MLNNNKTGIAESSIEVMNFYPRIGRTLECFEAIKFNPPTLLASKTQIQFLTPPCYTKPISQHTEKNYAKIQYLRNN